MPSAAIWLLTLSALMVDGRSVLITHRAYDDEASCKAAASISASQLQETKIKTSWHCQKIPLESLTLEEALRAYGVRSRQPASDTAASVLQSENRPNFPGNPYPDGKVPGMTPVRKALPDSSKKVTPPNPPAAASD